MKSEAEELLTLAVDTATERRSAAVFRGPRRLSVVESDLSDGGAANVLGDIERAVGVARVGLEEIELFAAANGPGSFTGLRAGVATLKGLALTLGKPVVGVQTLHALAHAARPSENLWALIPAGRGEVFAQRLCVSADGEVVEKESPAHVQPLRLIESIARSGSGVKWAGSGAHKFVELIREGAASAGLTFVAAEDATSEAREGVWLVAPAVESLAASVATLALSKYLRGEFERAESLRAIYVRPSDPELKEQCRERS